VGYIIVLHLIYGTTQMDVAAGHTNLLAHFSLQFSPLYLTHNLSVTAYKYLKSWLYKTGENFKNEGFNLRDKINVFGAIVTAYT
jgi:hypothetical protein